MDDSMAVSYEFAAFRCCFSSLQEGVKHDLGELVPKLFDKNLVSSANRDKSLSQTATPDEGAAHLLRVLESRIRGDPASFYSFLHELDCCPTLKFLAKKLQNELERIRGSHATLSRKRERENPPSIVLETKRIKREGEPHQELPTITEVVSRGIPHGQIQQLDAGSDHIFTEEANVSDRDPSPESTEEMKPCPIKYDKVPGNFEYMIKCLHLDHHPQKCPLTVVECDFHYAGCGVKLPRKDMAGHIVESHVAHMSLLAAHTKKTIADMQKTLNMETAQLRRQRDKDMVKMQNEIEKLKRENRSLKDRLHSHLHTPPVTFMMTNFAQQKRNKDTWYSHPFYTYPHGYKMCIKVECEDDKFFVGADLMRGQFDDSLEWPFQGIVYIYLQNQLSDDNHATIAGDFSRDPTFNNTGMRVTVGKRQEYGRGEYIPYATLNCHGDSTKRFQYLIYDCIQLQVARVVDTVKVQKEIVATIDHRSLHTPPCQFIMRNFEQHKKDGNNWWYSPSFYTHPQGYKMCLSVYANGFGVGRGTHVSVFTQLMYGEFDSHLEWPFQGNITIQLRNQLKDKQHRTKIIHYTDTAPGQGQVSAEEKSGGQGFFEFISHSKLGLNRAGNCQYLKDDYIIFLITKIDLKNN